MYQNILRTVSMAHTSLMPFRSRLKGKKTDASELLESFDRVIAPHMKKKSRADDDFLIYQTLAESCYELHLFGKLIDRKKEELKEPLKKDEDAIKLICIGNGFIKKLEAIQEQVRQHYLEEVHRNCEDGNMPIEWNELEMPYVLDAVPKKVLKARQNVPPVDLVIPIEDSPKIVEVIRVNPEPCENSPVVKVEPAPVPPPPAPTISRRALMKRQRQRMIEEDNEDVAMRPSTSNGTRLEPPGKAMRIDEDEVVFENGSKDESTARTLLPVRSLPSKLTDRPASLKSGPLTAKERLAKWREEKIKAGVVEKGEANAQPLWMKEPIPIFLKRVEEQQEEDRRRFGFMRDEPSNTNNLKELLEGTLRTDVREAPRNNTLLDIVSKQHKNNSSLELEVPWEGLGKVHEDSNIGQPSNNSCPFCPMTLIGKRSAITKHVREMHKDLWAEFAPLMCDAPECDYRATNAVTMKAHSAVSHSKEYANWKQKRYFDLPQGSLCPFCPEGQQMPLRNLGEYRFHVDEQHQFEVAEMSRAIKCVECGLKYQYTNDLFFHWIKRGNTCSKGACLIPVE